MPRRTPTWRKFPPARAFYFEGGYWLILWDFLYGAALYLFLLRFGWSAAMRNFAERATRFKPLQTFIYWSAFLMVTTILDAPLGLYEGYFRERQYGLATQTLLPWLGDQLIILLVNLVFGGIVAVVLVGVVRRLSDTWWIWGAVVSMVFLIFFVMIAPVFIFPLLNKYTVLEDPRITQPILSLARANGIPARKVYQMDASRQTARMSANVSGYGQIMRITLNDNLLRRGSPEEIQSVMGHEMGHYVLHHIAKDILYFSAVIVISLRCGGHSNGPWLAGENAGRCAELGIPRCFPWSSFWVRSLPSYTRHSLTPTSAPTNTKPICMA